MIYAPDTHEGKRFPWKDFLDGTQLPQATFKDLFEYEVFLKVVADTYETKGSMLDDSEMRACVEKVYFPMFKKVFISEEIFWAGALIPERESEINQPQIEGFVVDYSQKKDMFDNSEERRRFSSFLRDFRRALQVFSKALYDDPHAWFSDFEEYFRQQQNFD